MNFIEITYPVSWKIYVSIPARGVNFIGNEGSISFFPTVSIPARGVNFIKEESNDVPRTDKVSIPARGVNFILLFLDHYDIARGFNPR